MRSETGQMEGFKPPREDINSPDLYIPGKKKKALMLNKKRKTTELFTTFLL